MPLNTIAVTVAALLLLATSASAELAATVAQPPQAIVMRLFAAFNRHDLNAMMSLYTADAELTSPDFCTSRRGPEGVRKTYLQLFSTFPDIVDQPTGYVVRGDRVAVQFIARSEAAALELRLATFFTIRHGRIFRDATYFDTKGRPCT